MKNMNDDFVSSSGLENAASATSASFGYGDDIDSNGCVSVGDNGNIEASVEPSLAARVQDSLTLNSKKRKQTPESLLVKRRKTSDSKTESLNYKLSTASGKNKSNIGNASLGCSDDDCNTLLAIGTYDGNTKNAVTEPSLRSGSNGNSNSNSNSNSNRFRLGTATTDTPRSKLHAWYDKHNTNYKRGISKNYYVHIIMANKENRYTAAFVCPMTGELFSSGNLIHIEESVIINENSMWWYRTKKDAVNAAAGRAINNLYFRDCDQQDTRPGNKFCNEAIYEATEQSDIEEIPFLQECGNTIRMQIINNMTSTNKVFHPQNIIRSIREQGRYAEATGCLETALRHILTHIARIEGTYPKLHLCGETKHAIRSGEQPSIHVGTIQKHLCQAFSGGGNQTGYATMRNVNDVLRDDYGFTVRCIDQSFGGESGPGLLGLTTAPVLIICNMVHKKYKDEGKEIKIKNTMYRALALVQNDNGCNTLYDGDEDPIDLSTEDMINFKDYSRKCKKDEYTSKV
jgi:hypothetical protein